MRAVLFSMLLIAAAAGMAGFAQADARKPLCAGTIDFGNISDGLGSVNRNINSDLVALLAERSGCAFRVLFMPVKRVTLELANGTLHMSGRFFQTKEREEYLWFAHVQRTKVLGWYRPDRIPAARALSFGLSPDTVLGVTAGFTHSVVIDALVAERRRQNPGNVVEFPDRRALYLGLLAGRVDMMFMPSSVVEELNAAEAASARSIAHVDFAPDELGAKGGIVLSKKLFDAEAAARWQELIGELCEDGSILRVFQKYFKATEKDLACSLRTN